MLIEALNANTAHRALLPREKAKGASRRWVATLVLLAGLAACSEQQASDPAPATDALSQLAADPLSQPAAAAAAIRAADCSATGTVANLPTNDNFLAVRTGPGTNYREVARLESGVAMHLCTPAKDRRWVGVVYRPDGELPDAHRCRLTTDESPRYEGPCRSGWVSARYVAREGAAVEGGAPEAGYAAVASDNTAQTGGRAPDADAQIEQLGNEILLATPGSFTARHRDPDRDWTKTINNQIDLNGCSVSLRVEDVTRSREKRTEIRSANFDMKIVDQFNAGASSIYDYYYTNIAFTYNDQNQIVQVYTTGYRDGSTNEKDYVIPIYFEDDRAAKEVMLKLREMKRLCE